MINRRLFLTRFLSTAGCFAAAAAFQPFAAKASETKGTVRFDEGVASGDPMPDAMLFWTRAVDPGKPDAPQNLVLQVATDEQFDNVLLEKPVVALPSTDHTVRVFVDGLEADLFYFYRFLATDGGVSRVGRTRTAPGPESERTVTMASTSCQNYEVGFYQGWRRMIVDDEAAPDDEKIDVVLQIGDFIYEATGYMTPDIDFRRVHGDAPDLLDRRGHPRRLPAFPSGGVEADYADKAAKTVEDFRLIYRTYLRDPNLQDARARWPFVCTWDDHEFSDNSWQGHTSFGPRQSGRLAANQSWFEYVPASLSHARPAAGVAPAAKDFEPAEVHDAPFGAPGQQAPDQEPENLKAIDSMAIYRTLSFGKNAEIVVTDTRSYRDGPPQPKWWVDEYLEGKATPNGTDLVATLDAGREANDGNPPDMLTIAGKQLPNPQKSAAPRTMLGASQKDWWKQSISDSRKTWKFWVSSVPVAGLSFDFDAVPFMSVPRVMVSADIWTGYPGERVALLEHLRDNKVDDVVVLSGDMHLHAASAIRLAPWDPDQQPICSEFTVAGMSSESLFRSARTTFADDKRLDGLFAAGDNQEEEVFNNTLVKGVVSSKTYAATGSKFLAGLLSTDSANPELTHVDTSANGYGIVRAATDRLTVELVTIDPPVADLGMSPATVRRRVKFEQKPGENAARLTDFSGEPAFGMEVDKP